MEMLEEERKRAEEERRREITAKEIGRFHVRVSKTEYASSFKQKKSIV